MCPRFLLCLSHIGLLAQLPALCCPHKTTQQANKLSQPCFNQPGTAAPNGHPCRQRQPVKLLAPTNQANPVPNMFSGQRVLQLSIISNPKFIKSQLHRAIITSRESPTLLTLRDDSFCALEDFFMQQRSLDWKDDLFKRKLYDKDDLQHWTHHHLVHKARLDTSAQDLSNSPVHFASLVLPPIIEKYRFISSCNGIVFVANYNEDKDFGYLWNPCIRKWKEIPGPKLYTTSKWLPTKLGFGYDSISDDYKILRFTFEDLYDVVPIVQIYSTNADSWRQFREPILQNWNIYKETFIVVNGFLYFDGGNELITFDLHEEVFGLVPFPSFTHRKRSYVLDFEGSVAMVFKSGPGVDLWTLDDVSGQVCWTKKFSIHADLGTEIRLSCYIGAGQFYGTKYCDGDYFLYDILYDWEKRETKYYRLGDQRVIKNLKYIKSLVSLEGFKAMK